MNFLKNICFSDLDKIKFLRGRGYTVQKGFYSYPDSDRKFDRWEVLYQGREYMKPSYLSELGWLYEVFQDEIEKKFKELLLN